MVWLYLNSAMVESWIGQGTSWAKIHGKERLLVDPADTSKVAFRWASWHGSWSSVDSWGLSRIIRWQRILSVSLYGADRQSECASLEVEFVWWWVIRWWIHFSKKIFSHIYLGKRSSLTSIFFNMGGSTTNKVMRFPWNCNCLHP